MQPSHQSFLGYFRKFIGSFPDSCRSIQDLTPHQKSLSWIQVDFDYRPHLKLVFWMPTPEQPDLARPITWITITSPEDAQRIRGTDHNQPGWELIPEGFWNEIQGTPLGIPGHAIETFPELAYLKNFLRHGSRLHEILPSLWNVPVGPQHGTFNPAWWSIRKQVFLAETRAPGLPLKSVRFLFQGLRNAETLLADPDLRHPESDTRMPNFEHPGPSYKRHAQPEISVHLFCPDADLVARGFLSQEEKTTTGITQARPGTLRQDIQNHPDKIPSFIPPVWKHRGRARIHFHNEGLPDFPEENLELATQALHAKIGWLLRPRTELAGYLKFHSKAGTAYAAQRKSLDSAPERLNTLHALRPEIRISTRSPQDVLTRDL